MPLLLLLAFVVVPVFELYVIVQVGQEIGVLPTIGLLVLSSVVGAWLVRREGRRTWAAFRAALEAGRVPAKEITDGALVIVGGAFLLTPGFSTDVLGLLCVAPPSRALLRRVLVGLVATRLGPVGFVAGRVRDPRRYGQRPGAPGAPGTPGPSGSPGVIDGELDEPGGP